MKLTFIVRSLTNKSRSLSRLKSGSMVVDVDDIILLHVCLQHSFQGTTYYLNMLGAMIFLSSQPAPGLRLSVCQETVVSSLSAHRRSHSSAEEHRYSAVNFECFILTFLTKAGCLGVGSNNNTCVLAKDVILIL